MLVLVKNVLKVEWPINERHYFNFSKVCGEGNSVIFMKREILSGPKDTRICVTFLNDNKGFSEIQEIILLIMIIYEILLFFICFSLGD